MEQYDFTSDINLVGEAMKEMERLTNKEILALHEAMQEIKEQSETETVEKHMEWFDNAILPSLKRFAELTSSILEIERDRKDVIQATLRNSSCIEFSMDCSYLFVAIGSATDICVDVEDGDPVLVLTYDSRKF
ncbi:hypothetical protein [Enterocloster clostridioformis]|uniref:hypothetical protein n=1 Tax=Enterocloster clostridioformis TaxID=1531 RepID=UPI0022DF3E85|nr:hypothetical protein [Enterocloster clostridioformis]